MLNLHFIYLECAPIKIQTGQCPNCFTTNSLNSTHCLDCKSALPWSATVVERQRQIDAANAAAQATAQQQQAQQANQSQARQNIVQAQAARAQNSAGNAPPSAPGQALHINVFHVFADAFVGRFAETFENMDKAGAAWFGLICAVISNVCLAFGLRLIFQHLAGVFQAFTPFAPPVMPGNPLSPDIDDIPGAREIISLWKLIVVAFTPWLAIAISCTLARKLFGGEERHLEGDVFVAGVTLLPFSLLILLTGAVGYGNWEVLAMLYIFALCYTILLLYRGLTTVSGIRDMAAAFCVAPVIMLSGYLAKIVFTQLLTL